MEFTLYTQCKPVQTFVAKLMKIFIMRKGKFCQCVTDGVESDFDRNGTDSSTSLALT